MMKGNLSNSLTQSGYYSSETTPYTSGVATSVSTRNSFSSSESYIQIGTLRSIFPSPMSPEPEDLPRVSVTYTKEQTERHITPTDYCLRLKLASVKNVNEYDFESLKVLGTGAYGKVTLVRKTTGTDKDTLYARKSISKKSNKMSSKLVEHLKTERRVLEAIHDCPFLVHLNYAYQTDWQLNLILDYVPGGELFTIMERKGRLRESEAKFYTAEIILALETLHKMGIIYRDLKLENILIDAEGHVILTDFGLSKDLYCHKTGALLRTFSFCGTTEYMAPEVIDSKKTGYGFAADWWTVGILIFELLTGCTPFGIEGIPNRSEEIRSRILNMTPEMPEIISRDAASLIISLLEKNPDKRLGCGRRKSSEIKLHPFFRKINWTDLYNKNYQPPLVPILRDRLDTSNFSSEFTSQPITDTNDVCVANLPLKFRHYSFVSKSKVDLRNLITLPKLKPSNFEFEHCNQFFARYRFDTILLGTGSFGVVRMCKDKNSDEHFAVKIFSKSVENYAEIEILKMCQIHTNIVRFVEYFEANSQHYLVTELLDGGELLDRLGRPEQYVKVTFRKIASAVNYLHSIGIIHGDLKPENIVFTSRSADAEPKLIDFGSATYTKNPPERSFIPYTLEYAAPELLVPAQHLSVFCDVWSLGIILYMMLGGKHPFLLYKHNFNRTILQSTLKFYSIRWQKVSDSVKTLITTMLAYHADGRCSMFDVVNHEWLYDCDNSTTNNDQVASTSSTNSCNIVPCKRREQSSPLPTRPSKRLKSNGQ